MGDIPFKASDTLDLWQWLVLAAFCSMLVATAVLAKWYASRKKGISLLEALKPEQSSKTLQDVQLHQRVLSRNTKLYSLTINGKEHVILETDKGLIELDTEQTSDR